MGGASKGLAEPVSAAKWPGGRVGRMVALRVGPLRAPAELAASRLKQQRSLFLRAPIRALGWPVPAA